MKRLAIAVVGLSLALALLACGEEEEVKEMPTATIEEVANPTAKPTDTPSAEARSHYENTVLGFAFDYPDDWERIEGGMGYAAEAGEAETLATIAVGSMGEQTGAVLRGMSVEVYGLEETIPQEDLDERLLEIDDLVAQAVGQAGGALGERGWTVLGELRARRYTLDFPLASGELITNEIVVTVREDQMLQLTCQAEQARFEDIHTRCQVVYDSFEFTSEQ